MIVELYTFEDEFRHIEVRDYSSLGDWEKDYMILRIRDTWAGHKIFNTTREKYDAMDSTQRANNADSQKFDRSAVVKHFNLNKNYIQGESK